MKDFWVGTFCVIMCLCCIIPAKASQDFTPKQQKIMSIVISELTRTHLDSVQPEHFFDPKNPDALLYFGAHYVERVYGLSKARLAPALLKSGGSAPLGERIVSLEDVKTAIKRFFDYDLPVIAPGQYGTIHFDGKDFHMRMSAGAPAYWAQVTQAKSLPTGNIAVEGVLRNPEHKEVIKFSAELKKIEVNYLDTYAIVSLTATNKRK